MSWLNNLNLNTIKGQLTNLANEILEETAGPGDDEYRERPRSPPPAIDNKTAIAMLADTQREKEELDKLCSDKEMEILALRKQIETLLQNQISDTGGGGAGGGGGVSGGSRSIGSGASGGSGRTSKSPIDNATAASVGTLEDSWCWEPDNVKTTDSETSSGNGNEIVNITLEEVPLGGSAKAGSKTKIHRLGSSGELQKRIQQLEEENKQLNNSLEELDTQHNLEMQNVLELKTELQEKLHRVSRDYENLKQKHEEKFIQTELEMAKMKKLQEQSDSEKLKFANENEKLKQKLEESSKEIKRVFEEMSDLQSLLEKKSQDNQELIQRIKEVSEEAQKDKEDLQVKLEHLTQEIEELKVSKTKKTSESSNSSSNGKQSEDEFIVVNEKDANSSSSGTPPSKEELKDRVVALENRVSELTLENGSLSLKLQDREMEKDLSLQVLKDNLKSMQQENYELNEKLRMALIDLEDQQFKIADLKEKASEAIIAQEQLKALNEEKLKFAAEIKEMREYMNNSLELEKRLLLAEQEKEALQLELQSSKGAVDRINALEQKIQKLTYENQQLQLNAEAETETLNNSAELEQKLKELNEENNQLKTELEQRSGNNNKKQQCVTDLDDEEGAGDDGGDDGDDDSFSVEKLKTLLKAFSSSSADLENLNLQEYELFYKNLKERLNKIDTLQRDLNHMSAEVMDLQDSKLMWDHEKKTLEADISQYILQCDELMKNNEILLNELENYKRNKLETIHENNEENVMQLETQLDECTKLNRTLEQEYMELNEKIEELEKENQTLNEKLRDTQQQYESLTTREKDLNLQVETLELEKCNLLLKFNEFDSKAQSKEEDNQRLQEFQVKCHSLEQQLSSLAKDHADLVNAMQKQKESLQENIQAKEEAEKQLRLQEIALEKQREKEKSTLEELQQKLATFQTQAQNYQQELMAKNIVCESLQQEIKVLQSYVENAESIANEKALLEEQLNEKLQAIQELQTELKSLQEKQDALIKDLEDHEKSKANEDKSLENIQKIAELEAKLLATADLQKSLETLQFEKQELIKALQQKHAENMQYYTEIQRLTPLVQQQQQQSETAEPPSVESNKPCDKCPELESTIAELKKQQEKFQDQINFLKEKSDILTTNLLTEQTNQKLIQEEKADVLEQNATLRKDVERLRAHLLEIEDMHTQESVEMQRELDETKARMQQLEIEVSKSSNAYTSASIRANQHAETLQAQYALVIQQRDELLHKLSLAEDRESKNQAALTNLQCALEQFQNDKENDIKSATLRIRKELQQHLDKESQLQMEIQQLQQQLSDATQGLNAAARLSDQLESCQQTIQALREEVDSLKQQNTGLEKKLTTAEASQSDKIEKTLIKSLLIGYVVSTNPNDKQQILRMISSVLDFNQSETDKVGLNKQHGGWLGSLLGGGGGSGSAAGSHSKENLVQAFVQFLEQESQPQSQRQQMPNLLNIQHSTAPGGTGSASRRSSQITNPIAPQQPQQQQVGTTTSASPSSSTTAAAAPHTPVPIQPLLLSSTVLDEFSPSRNSSSILKDILSDS